MALKPASKSILDKLFGPLHLPPADLAVLTTETPQDLNNAVALMLADKRRAPTAITVTGLVTGAVSNWPNLTAAGVAADSSALEPALDAFAAALAAKDAPLLFSTAVTAAFAATKLIARDRVKSA